jgi:NCAIR mutase (PurE)-related protein
VNGHDLARLLQEVAQGLVPVTDALEQLQQGPFRSDETSFATPDFHRRLRLGMGEVVYGEGKTVSQILEIVERLSQSGEPVLVTRLDTERLDAVEAAYPKARLNRTGRTALVNSLVSKDASSGEPFVAVVSAGTSDQPVVEEACEVCVAMNVAYEKVTDVGVAGVHRMVNALPLLRKAAAIVVVAGMDGALPSVIGGLVGRPVIGVPTSVGYGVSLGGLSALFTMLNSCAPGVTVTNIDAGFSGAVAACNIVRGVREADADRAESSAVEARDLT